ncbi:hypothetical protein [Streptomyces sp. NPDC049915]|uniref:hypothetical protein n=1 Tax=Streptomyces sp. NPDC049915 TaxID=3155510 RepID=UPI00342EC4C4
MPAHRRALGVGAAAALLLGGAGPAAARPAADRPAYEVEVAPDYLTADVGGTVTIRPQIYASRPDGSQEHLAEGEPVGRRMTLEYALPGNTTPVGVGKGCRKLVTGWARHVTCTSVRPLTVRIDRALVAEETTVTVRRAGWAADSGGDRLLLTAPVPQEEGESRGSREGRQKAGAVLLGVAGGFALLALFLGRTRTRRAVWVSCAVVGLLCAGPGVWSMTREPLIGAKSYVRYRSGPPVLKIPDTLWDDGWIRSESRPDGVPRITTAPDRGHEDVTEVSGFFAPYVDEPTGTPGQWLTVDGAYGRIEDPRRARDHMLRTAAGAPGATVAEKPRLFLLKSEEGIAKGPVLFKCQVIVVREQHVHQCAWADRGVRALLSTSGGPAFSDSGDPLLGTAHDALSVREYVQLGGGF